MTLDKKILFETKIELEFPKYKEITEMIDLPIDEMICKSLVNPKIYKLVDTKSSLDCGVFHRDYYLIYNTVTREYDMLIKHSYNKYFFLWSEFIEETDNFELIDRYIRDRNLVIKKLIKNLNLGKNFAFKFLESVYFDIRYDDFNKTLFLKRLDTVSIISECNTILVLRYLFSFVQNPITVEEFRNEVKKMNKKLFDEYQKNVRYFTDFLKK